MNYKIVIDTNLVVSALINPKGVPAKIFELIIGGQITLISSHAVLDEVRRVFSYPHIRKAINKKQKEQGRQDFKIDQHLEKYIIQLSQIATIVEGKTEIDIIQRDLSDNMFLECAVEGEADYIVSGDKHLLDLKKFQNIPILTASQFLALDIIKVILNKF